MCLFLVCTHHESQTRFSFVSFFSIIFPEHAFHGDGRCATTAVALVSWFPSGFLLPEEYRETTGWTVFENSLTNQINQIKQSIVENTRNGPSMTWPSLKHMPSEPVVGVGNERRTSISP